MCKICKTVEKSKLNGIDMWLRTWNAYDLLHSNRAPMGLKTIQM